jgi:uncharacterized protein YndB with AHSA1/START domain
MEVAGPPDRVWAALTTPASTRQFLFGIALESSWTAGSPITGSIDGAPVLAGEVLFAEYPHRLSYVLFAGAGHPGAYVTWEVPAGRGNATVQLCVDEADADIEEIAAAWQPVVTAFQALLLTRAS